MENLLNNLNNLKGQNVRLKDLFVRHEENCVVICLEYTIYDYDFRNDELMTLLDNYNYEWYNSTEIEVYFN